MGQSTKWANPSKTPLSMLDIYKTNELGTSESNERNPN
jgi:hypothetical protein